MTTTGQVGLLRNPGDEGTGWTGVTDDDKRWAGGQAPLGATVRVRWRFAVDNAEHVADAWGTKHWTGGR